MIKTVLIVTFLLLTNCIFSQLNIADTFSLILKEKLSDTAKIDKLNQYIFQYSSNNPELVLIYSDSAIALSSKINDSLRLANSTNRKGIAFFYLGDYNSSLENYFHAIKIKESIGEANSIWREYNNIGLVLRNLEQNQEALRYFNIALANAVRTKNKSHEALVLNNIGISYRGLKNNTEAQQVIEKALNINNEIGATQSKAHNLNNLGNIYFDRREFNSAIDYLSKALILNKSLNNNYEQIQNLNNLAKVYLEIPNYPKAKINLSNSENLLSKIQANKLKLENLLIFGNYYISIKDYKNAVSYRNRYVQLRDSLMFTDRVKQFDQLKTLANIEKEIEKVAFLEKINSIQEDKIRIQNIIQIGGSLVILLILFLLVIVIRNLAIKKRLNKSLRERTYQVETLNKELQSTIEELHDQHDNLEDVLCDLQKTQSQLIHSEKMASLGVMAIGIAHEINNPLNFIHGGVLYIETYLKDNFPDKFEEIRPMVEGINTGVKRTADIVKSLNQYSRSETVPHTNCSLHNIIDDCLIILNNQFKNRIEVQKHYTQLQYNFWGNEGKLHQVFLNILVNASHAINGKGSIIITSDVINDEVQIVIIDNGSGISDENLKKIFDPFFTTKLPGEGTGLGLSITHNIIQEYNGSIQFESQIGKGTKVIIKLPIKTY